MMGKQPQRQDKLSYYCLCFEKRIPQEHLLRKIHTTVDFDFTYGLAEKHNRLNGNVSIPPPVIVKLMLLFLYDVPSERKLMRTLPYRLDWLWFLGYDLDSEIATASPFEFAKFVSYEVAETL